MLKLIQKICNRIIFLLWVFSCIAAIGYFVISLVSYSDYMNATIAWLLCCLEPVAYQFGLNFFDFENGINMFDEETEERNDDD